MSQTKNYSFIKYAIFSCFMCFVVSVVPNALAQITPDASMDELALEKLALAGSTEARDLFLQGKKHHDGDGVKQNFSKARAFYIQAAELDSNDARLNLGYLYFMGQGVKQDYVQARQWYMIAAVNGSKDAQTNLAMIYENGLGVEKSMKKAQYWRDYQSIKPDSTLRIKTIETKASIVESTPLTNQTVEAATSVVSKPATIQSAVIKAVSVKPKPIAYAPVKTNNLRKPTLMLRRDTKQNTAAPVWMSNVLIGILLALALLSGVWFMHQYIKLKKQRQARVFIRAFYAHHRDRLRTNYLRYPIQARNYGHIDDLWAVALCVLMVKFAERQQNSRDLVGAQSRNIISALEQGALKARQAVFPFVERTQQKVLADIYANDCAPGDIFKPIRFPQKPKPKPKFFRLALTSNIVNLDDVRDKIDASIPPGSLWPDKTGGSDTTGD